MAGTSISTLTHSAQQAQEWVNELALDLSWSHPRAYRLLRCVLHQIRDWLPQEEMADLSAQLPTLIGGIYFEGWDPLVTPVWERSKDAFLRSVQETLTNEDTADCETAVAAVFKLLDRHISHGEIVQVRGSMKKSLRELWPSD